MAEVLEAAIIEPSCGKRSFWELTVLNTHQPAIFPRCVQCSNPLRTPSICRSIHHIPGTPSMDHNEAFLPMAPIGSHCRKKKYVKLKARRKGIRNTKRKMWNGR